MSTQAGLAIAAPALRSSVAAPVAASGTTGADGDPAARVALEAVASEAAGASGVGAAPRRSGVSASSDDPARRGKVSRGAPDTTDRAADSRGVTGAADGDATAAGLGGATLAASGAVARRGERARDIAEGVGGASLRTEAGSRGTLSAVARVVAGGASAAWWVACRFCVNQVSSPTATMMAASIKPARRNHQRWRAPRASRLARSVRSRH
jgi:hypothetical protein